MGWFGGVWEGDYDVMIVLIFAIFGLLAEEPEVPNFCEELGALISFAHST